MKIILLKDVKGQGKKHEIIEVKDGYGNNFLIKNGFGVLATEDSIKRLKKDMQKETDEENRIIDKAREDKIKIENMAISFSLKTGVSDKTFGSISPKQIATVLKEKDIEIDKKKIMIAVPIASIGFHIVKIELYKNIIAELRIEIKKEK